MQFEIQHLKRTLSLQVRLLQEDGKGTASGEMDATGSTSSRRIHQQDRRMVGRAGSSEISIFSRKVTTLMVGNVIGER